MPTQVLRAVLNRRAGQCPASPARDRAHDLARRAVAVFDPLRFVKHNQIEMQARLDDQPSVAIQSFIVGDLDRARRAIANASVASS